MTVRFPARLRLVVCLVIAPLAACERAPAPAPAPAPAATSGHGHDAGHSHGEATALGEQIVGGFTIKASREGDLDRADVPIDVWITGDAANIAAVRFWIGTRDAKGSIKAKASLERDNWHTHVEIPKPLPEGSRLWIEIEPASGERVIADFDLKQ